MAEEQAAPVAPIIIKRIKKGGHAHHGGAWKVAYADFVTAMMAFFLLLWLISVTTDEQKKGIADYFTPTFGIKDSKGIGFKGGKHASPEGTSRTDLTIPGLVLGQVQQGPVASTPETKQDNEDSDSDSTSKSNKADNKEDSEQFKITTQDVKQSLEQDPDIKDYQNNVVVQDVPEGLKIDIIDDQKKPMFVPGGAALTDAGKKILDSMAAVIVKTPNNLSIDGHTDAGGATANPQYTNWELSADRANSARRFMTTTQIEPERIQRVIGMADRELLTPQEPTSPRNRRITIVLMRGSYFRDPKSAPTTRTLLSVPDAKIKKDEPPPPPKPVEEQKPEGIFDPTKKPDGPQPVTPKDGVPAGKPLELPVLKDKPAAAPADEPKPADYKPDGIFDPTKKPEKPAAPPKEGAPSSGESLKLPALKEKKEEAPADAPKPADYKPEGIFVPAGQ